MKAARKEILRKRLLDVCWSIIEYKIYYYYPELVHPSWHKKLTIHDDLYDELERQYLRLCFALKCFNTNVHKVHFEWQDNTHAMFEVDFDRPSVQLVLSKIGRQMNEQTAENIVFDDKVIDLEERRAAKLRKATGGSGPTGGRGNWLAELELGTRFLARHKFSVSEVDEFIVTTDPKKMSVILLAKNIKGRDGVFEWHDHKLFSSQYIFYEILEIVDTNDGNIKQVQTERMVGDGQPEDLPEVHEPE